MNKKQIELIVEAYSHGDDLVFQVGERVFVAEQVLKHRKEATIEMMQCSEVDETCFDSEDEYYGDVLAGSYRIILNDPYADYENSVATVYYDDEIVEFRKERR